MPRPRREIPVGSVAHVLNRAVNRGTIFASDADYLEFLAVMRRAAEATGVLIYAYCLMPNHWHIVVRSMSEGDVSRFMHLLTSTHARRWRKRNGTTGLGAVYQGRFRCVLVQDGYHLAVLLRYVERNALRAGLVRRAEDWRWCSLAQRLRSPRPDDAALAAWPDDTAAPADWVRHVNEPLFEHEHATERIRTCIRVQVPFGTLAWTAARWGRARDPGRVARILSRGARSASGP